MTLRMPAAGLLLVIVAGCSPSVEPGLYQTYDQLQSQRPDSPQTAAIGTEPTPLESTAREPATIGEPPTTESATSTAPLPAPGAAQAQVAVEELPVSALAPLNVVDGGAVAAVLKVVPATASAAPSASLPAQPLPGGVQLLVPDKTFRVEGPKQAVRVSYDDFDLLKILNMEPVPENAAEFFPSWLEGLHGKRIRLRGFMYPTFESSGLDRFVLARDNQICCFGRDPKIYDLVAVEMQSGKTTDYIPNRPFDVVGTFRIETVAEGGKLFGLFHLDDAQVIDR